MQKINLLKFEKIVYDNDTVVVVFVGGGYKTFNIEVN